MRRNHSGFGSWEGPEQEQFTGVLISPSPPKHSLSPSRAVEKKNHPKQKQLGLSVLDVEYIRISKGGANNREGLATDIAQSVDHKSSKKVKKKLSKKQILEEQELIYRADRKTLVKTYKICCETLCVEPDNSEHGLLQQLSHEPDTKKKDSALLRKLQIMSTVGPAGARALMSALAGQYVGACEPGKVLSTGYPHINEMEFFEARIGYIGASAISGFLLHNMGRSLKKLTLQNASITESGARALGNSLRYGYNRTLEELYILCDQSISDCGVVALCRGLATNRGLKALSIVGCGVGPEGAEGMADILRYKSKLECVSLRSNQLMGRGLLALAGAIKENKSLKFLNVANISVGPLDTEPVEKFGEAIVACESLSCVDFNYNPVGELAASKLAETLTRDEKASKHLTQLSITTDIPSHLFEQISRSFNGSSKNGKKKMAKKKCTNSTNIPPLQPDLFYALKWMKKLKALEEDAKQESKTGSKTGSKKKQKSKDKS